MDEPEKILVILLGPTGVGKTSLSLRLAGRLGSPILSADSRQIFRETRIGTAQPTPEQLARVRHYFIATHSIHEYYSASRFEEEAIPLIRKLHCVTPTVLVCGGSMMYLDALRKGIDEMPTVRPDIREAVWKDYETRGLEPLLEELREKDPIHYEQVDRKNYRRVIHALELCRQTGVPYSSFRVNQPKKRDFRVIEIGLTRPREELYERINQRVDQMMDAGLLEEARALYPFRHLNALNTVGYKELFLYFDGTWPLDLAIEKIKRDTRVYARKQMTWFKRDPLITWFHPDQETEILSFLEDQINRGHEA